MSAGAVAVSAPGSIMITGEHAVVYGHPAIVCAIEQRVRVEAAPLTERRLEIVSEIAPALSVPLDRISVDGPYRFVLSAVKLHAERLSHGLRLTITSEIDPTLGLGSSAAVTVACLGALAHLTGTDRSHLHTQALAIIRHIQGRGSGADLAASLHGGMIAYRLPEAMLSGVPVDEISAEIVHLPEAPVLSLCYCGYKTPTAEVLARVAQAMEGREAEYSDLYQRMGSSASDAIATARDRDWPAFGAALTTYQALMEELGVSDPTLDRIIGKARACPQTLAAKISGSGLGDCVLAVGAVPEGFVPAPVAAEGMRIHD
ncbi:MAG: hypothetical protein AAGA50_20160 [Pseudomonadota bacterium]